MIPDQIPSEWLEETGLGPWASNSNESLAQRSSYPAAPAPFHAGDSPTLRALLSCERRKLIVKLEKPFTLALSPENRCEGEKPTIQRQHTDRAERGQCPSPAAVVIPTRSR
jgi:hypothetical protein